MLLAFFFTDLRSSFTLHSSLALHTAYPSLSLHVPSSFRSTPRCCCHLATILRCCSLCVLRFPALAPPLWSLAGRQSSYTACQIVQVQELIPALVLWCLLQHSPMAKGAPSSCLHMPPPPTSRFRSLQLLLFSLSFPLAVALLTAPHRVLDAQLPNPGIL